MSRNKSWIRFVLCLVIFFSSKSPVCAPESLPRSAIVTHMQSEAGGAYGCMVHGTAVANDRLFFFMGYRDNEMIAKVMVAALALTRGTK